jgi:hypothetical protein
MEINNSCSSSSYRKKRFSEKRNEISSQIEEVNDKLAKLNLNKTLKLSKNEYVFLINCSDSTSFEQIHSQVKNGINMQQEKELVESHYNKVNKFLFDTMFNQN